jgi:hypothetical protein
MVVNRDCVVSPGDVPRGRGHDVSAIPPDIYSRANFLGTVRNEPAGMAEYDVLATPTREKPPGLRQGSICSFKGGKTFIATMSRINIERDDSGCSTSKNAYIPG